MSQKQHSVMHSCFPKRRKQNGKEGANSWQLSHVVGRFDRCGNCDVAVTKVAIDSNTYHRTPDQLVVSAPTQRTLAQPMWQENSQDNMRMRIHPRSAVCYMALNVVCHAVPQPIATVVTCPVTWLKDRRQQLSDEECPFHRRLKPNYSQSSGTNETTMYKLPRSTEWCHRDPPGSIGLSSNTDKDARQCFPIPVQSLASIASYGSSDW